LDKLQDTGNKENHGCAGLTASRKLPAYVWELLKETLQDRKKWHMLVEEKSQNKECTNVKRMQERQWQTTPEQHTLPS
jgi:hypothetical protein